MFYLCLPAPSGGPKENPFVSQTAPAPTSDGTPPPGPDALLHTIGLALVDTLDVSVLSDVVIETTPEFAASIWRAWDARADYARKCAELQALARTADDQLEDMVDAVVRAIGLSPRDEQTESVFAYLHLLPATIRRRFRRPANSQGTALPAALPLYGSWDLLPLLPARMPKLRPGDRPWGIGDWELRELIELNASGEVWKAVNPRRRDRPAVALHFFTSPAVRRALRDQAAFLDRALLHGRLPGVVPLQEVHLLADPPCVQLPYLQAADLASLVLEAREAGASLAPLAVADLVVQIAETLGRLHALQPFVVHRNLCGESVLLMNGADGRRRCLLTQLGLGCVVGGAAPYASPALLAGEPCQPEDDIYALGVLWYQLLEGDLERCRPGGASWRRRLTARGMSPALVELLETCFDDDPTARPANGAALAMAMRPFLPQAV